MGRADTVLAPAASNPASPTSKTAARGRRRPYSRFGVVGDQLSRAFSYRLYRNLGMRSLWVHFLLLAGFTTTIVIVVTLIVQLDYPFRRDISVSNEPFEHALSQLEALSAAR
jgi:hypothetical protein